MKTLKIIIISTVLSIGLLSCTDESLNPMPEITTFVGLVRGDVILPEGDGGYLKINQDNDGDGEIDPVISIQLEAPQDNVDVYTIMGKIADFENNVNNAVYGDYTPIKTINEFPGELTITAEEVAAAFDMVPSDFSPPNHKLFKFIGISKSNGITVNLDYVTGAGFSGSDDTDGLISGLTSLYQPTKAYVLYYQ